ncbi:MAG: magnesium and cobalt transport protein CorA [Sphingomonadales bacterium]|nr:magnesium and cobalt transport protein CorA [Sphingomonadales bacterium]
MPIVTARRYSSGTTELHALAIDGGPRSTLPPHTFDWVGLYDPAPEEMDAVRRQFGLHPLAVEDATSPTQLPKVDVYGRLLFIVARTAELDEGEKIAYGQTALFLGPDYLVTVRFGSTRAHSPIRHRLEANQERLAEGADYVAHAILDFIVDGFQPIIDRFEERVQTMEEHAIDSFPQPSTIRRIFRLRRQIRRFERIVGPMDAMCQRLSTTELPNIDPAAHVWFRDVLDHVRRAMARMRGLKETLESIVETASLLEQHRQGMMTRQLAAWAAILAVPTAIAGIYGMNFQFMPELHWRYGYFLALGLSFGSCGGLWWQFRRIGWL